MVTSTAATKLAVIAAAKLHRRREAEIGSGTSFSIAGVVTEDLKKIGRAGEIRTRDPQHPMLMRYQAALLPAQGRNYSKRARAMQRRGPTDEISLLA
jgi:hypothetical protein